MLHKHLWKSLVHLIVKSLFGNHTTDAEFCVISGKGESLLAKDTAIMLGALKIGIGMVSVKLGSQNSG